MAVVQVLTKKADQILVKMINERKKWQTEMKQKKAKEHLKNTLISPPGLDVISEAGWSLGLGGGCELAALSPLFPPHRARTKYH